jgi:hypothetical protein
MKRQLLSLGLAAAACVCASACSENEPPSTMHQRQDAAMRDPWNYTPHGVDQTDISGGGMMDFKSKAFRKDVDSVLNP